MFTDLDPLGRINRLSETDPLSKLWKLWNVREMQSVSDRSGITVPAWPVYSYLSDALGSSLAARRAAQYRSRRSRAQHHRRSRKQCKCVRRMHTVPEPGARHRAVARRE